MLMDWINERCDGCIQESVLQDAKTSINEEVSRIQASNERAWKQEYEEEQRKRLVEEQSSDSRASEEASERAKLIISQKAELTRAIEKKAQERWAKEREIEWQQEELRQLEEQAQQEQLGRQKIEEKQAEIRHEKLQEKKRLYEHISSVLGYEEKRDVKGRASRKQSQAIAPREISSLPMLVDIREEPTSSTISAPRIKRLGGLRELALNMASKPVRTCPKAASWVEYGTADNGEHAKVECSMKGACVRASGTCNCFNGYYGEACEKLAPDAGGQQPHGGKKRMARETVHSAAKIAAEVAEAGHRYSRRARTRSVGQSEQAPAVGA
jgi:hypothetical protein